jgi:hypothetical protein
MRKLPDEEVDNSNMPSAINWYIPERILYVRVWGAMNTTEGARTNQQAASMIETGKPLVHVLIDDQELKSVTNNLAAIQKTMQVYKHPSLGWVLSIGHPNVLIRFVMSMMSQIFQVRARRFYTIEEALVFLRERDQTLPWELANTEVIAPDARQSA